MSKAERILLYLWLPCLLIGGWEASARTHFIDPLFFPAPSAILEAGRRLTLSGELPRHLVATVSKWLVSFAAAALAGVTCGIVTAIFPRVNRSLEPLISALYTTPKISLLPMAFLLFGVGDTARMVLVSLSAFIIVTLHSFDAVRGMNRAFVDMASNYGASGLRMVRCVYLPASLPQMFTGLRLAFGRSLVMTITVEVISGRDGLGSMIWIAGQTLATEKLYLGIVLAAALGGISHSLLRFVEVYAIPWKARHGH